MAPLTSLMDASHLLVGQCPNLDSNSYRDNAEVGINWSSHMAGQFHIRHSLARARRAGPSAIYPPSSPLKLLVWISHCWRYADLSICALCLLPFQAYRWPYGTAVYLSRLLWCAQQRSSSGCRNGFLRAVRGQARRASALPYSCARAAA